MNRKLKFGVVGMGRIGRANAFFRVHPRRQCHLNRVVHSLGVKAMKSGGMRERSRGGLKGAETRRGRQGLASQSRGPNAQDRGIEVVQRMGAPGMAVAAAWLGLLGHGLHSGAEQGEPERLHPPEQDVGIAREVGRLEEIV